MEKYYFYDIHTFFFIYYLVFIIFQSNIYKLSWKLLLDLIWRLLSESFELDWGISNSDYLFATIFET
jgi:hypothetical protein